MGRTVAQLYHQFVGRKALLTLLDYKEVSRSGVIQRPASVGIMVPVTCGDARCSYGTDQVLVEPFCGRGTAWVDADRLTVVDEWQLPQQEQGDGAPVATHDERSPG